MARRVSDAELEALLELVQQTEAVDEPHAPSARTPDCLAMPRLETLGTHPQLIRVAEATHLEVCTLCEGRLLAFRELERAAVSSAAASSATPSSATPAREAVPASARPRHTLALAVLGCLAVAVALSWFHEQPQQRATPAAPPGLPPEAVGTEPAGPELAARGEFSSDCDTPPVRICIEVDSEPSQPDTRCVTVELEAREDVTAVAILHTWDEVCQCLRAELHQWHGDDGRAQGHSSLSLGEVRSFDFQLGDSSGVDQHLTVVSVPRGDALSAEDVLRCLNPDLCSGDSTVNVDTACLESHGCVIEKAIVMR